MQLSCGWILLIQFNLCEEQGVREVGAVLLVEEWDPKTQGPTEAETAWTLWIKNGSRTWAAEEKSITEINAQRMCAIYLPRVNWKKE